MIHELSEPTKRALDAAAFIGSFAAISMANFAFAVSIVAGLLSILWTVIRVHDRLRYGPGGRE